MFYCFVFIFKQWVLVVIHQHFYSSVPVSYMESDFKLLLSFGCFEATDVYSTLKQLILSQLTIACTVRSIRPFDCFNTILKIHAVL